MARMARTVIPGIPHRATHLGVTTVGGVVAVGEALMRIVPSDDALEVSATVANRDIGFVAEGQEAVVKLDAFSYRHFGTLAGTGPRGRNPQAPPSYTARPRA